VGLLAFGLAYLGLGQVSGGWQVYALMALYGLFPAFTDGVGKAWVSSLVPAQHLGRALGVYQGLNNGAVLLAGLWAGLLWGVGAGSGVVPLTLAGCVGVMGALAVAVR
jgi:MFS family permease